MTTSYTSGILVGYGPKKGIVGSKIDWLIARPGG